MKKVNLGNLGENLARKYLKRNGYKILTHNFRSKFGEIDIIAYENDVLVFVEVKTRWSRKFGSPEEAITPWKIEKILKTGEYYASLHSKLAKAWRIDAVVVDFNLDGKLERIEIIKNITE